MDFVKITAIFLFFPIFIFGVPDTERYKSPAPFLSSDSFRGYADYVFENLETFKPESVKPNSTIYVIVENLDLFFEKAHPYIPCKYILITHNSDRSVPEYFVPYLDDEKLLAWFAADHDGTVHPKMHPIPYGIACYYLPFGDVSALKRVQEENYPKVHLAYMNMNVETYPEERRTVFNFFFNKPFCYTSEKKPYEDFLIDLASSIFCICPRGAGLDTYRLWESLYLGTIPIVKTSSLDPLYSDLPVLIVSDWKIVNKQFLRRKYREMKSKTYNMDKLYTAYWFRLIDSFKVEK